MDKDTSTKRQRAAKTKYKKQGSSTDEEDKGSEYSECHSNSNDERSPQPKVISVDSTRTKNSKTNSSKEASDEEEPHEHLVDMLLMASK